MQRGFRSRVVAVFLPLALPALLAAFGNTAAADDEPTIAKDSIRVNVKTSSCIFGERGCDKNTNFLDPYIHFDVNGPIAGGSQLSVEFTVPGKPPRKWDCNTLERPKGKVLKTECGSKGGEGNRGFAYQGAVSSGPVGFSIQMRNEVLQTNAPLFTGKMKVGKYKPSPTADFKYYVDEDWRIPIGYIYFEDVGGGTLQLGTTLWFRGNPGEVDAFLLYQGKQLAKDMCYAGLNGSWNPTKPEWAAISCKFPGVYATPPQPGYGQDPRYALSQDPGEYEIKVLSGGHLARSTKFTVGPEAKFDNGIATANKLGSDRVIVPVQVIGNQGPWDKNAWKTEAFYGNPLTGFTPVQ
jgi:hypothetical protein